MARLTEEEYYRITGNRLPPKEKKGKYRNEKILGYDSKQELGRAGQLKLEEKMGLITNLQEQVYFTLQESFEIEDPTTKTGKRKIQAIRYKADFFYHRKGEHLPTVEDSKGYKTDTYKLKAKMFLKRYQGVYNFIETSDSKWTLKTNTTTHGRNSKIKYSKR